MEHAETTLRIDSPHRFPGGTPGCHVRSGLHYHEVEALLDGLEARGVSRREVKVEIDGTFQVRWEDE